MASPMSYDANGSCPSCGGKQPHAAAVMCPQCLDQFLDAVYGGGEISTLKKKVAAVATAPRASEEEFDFGKWLFIFAFASIVGLVGVALYGNYRYYQETRNDVPLIDAQTPDFQIKPSVHGPFKADLH